MLTYFNSNLKWLQKFVIPSNIFYEFRIVIISSFCWYLILLIIYPHACEVSVFSKRYKSWSDELLFIAARAVSGASIIKEKYANDLSAFGLPGLTRICGNGMAKWRNDGMGSYVILWPRRHTTSSNLNLIEWLTSLRDSPSVSEYRRRWRRLHALLLAWCCDVASFSEFIHCNNNRGNRRYRVHLSIHVSLLCSNYFSNAFVYKCTPMFPRKRCRLSARFWLTGN